MQPASTLRQWQCDALKKNVISVQLLLSYLPADDLTRWRDGGTGWTALETLCHLRDFEVVFVDRAKVAVEHEGGDLPFPDPNKMAVERQYNAQSPAEVVAAWAANRTAFLAYLGSLEESAWSRVARHPTRGMMMLSDQLTLIVWHDSNHLEQIARTLAEQRAG